MSITGDKASSRKVASRITSIVDGGEVSNEMMAIDLAEEIGYPVILKAVQGGGGRGLRIIRSFEETEGSVCRFQERGDDKFWFR